MSDRIILVDSDMRVSARNAKRTDTGDPLGTATESWQLLDATTRATVASGSGSLRAGSTNDYDAVIDESVLATLTVDAFYILRVTVSQSGRQRVIERRVQAKRGY